MKIVPVARIWSLLVIRIIIIIIIIIKKDWQCKAGRGRLPPYQSEDPAPQYQPIEERREREISWRQKSR